MFLKNEKVMRGVVALFGLMLLVFGLNGFFQFFPIPSFNEAGTSFLGALFATGYIFTIINVLWILFGVAFLLNRYVSLGGIVLFPISLNILLFHLFLDYSGIAMGAAVFVLNAYVLYIKWDDYKPLFELESGNF